MPVDLRSDTVTRPTEGMRRAMYEAEVGDNIYGEDPTVNRLQADVAALLGKEDALFVPSGIMANQLALLVHTRPGDEIIVERKCHIFNHEGGAPGFLNGVQTCPMDGDRGLLTPEHVEQAIRKGFYNEPTSRLLCLENTHNHAGGRVLPQESVAAAADLARRNGLSVHLDGARLWNAAAATGRPIAALAAPFDTVSVCLSKGLGAPVGSLLAGPADLIKKALRFRNSIGGGMRQSGILAAAGLYALAHHRDRLADDHRRARILAEALSQCADFRIDPADVDTNIVLFRVDRRPVADVLNALRAHDIWMSPFGPGLIRAVVHLDISEADIQQTVTTLNRLFGS
ncbi:MAG: GntG family PLP-dependent aldolase [Rhodothermales bacterium]